jgi:DNA replication licensing factor MCM4
MATSRRPLHPEDSDDDLAAASGLLQTSEVTSPSNGNTIGSQQRRNVHSSPGVFSPPNLPTSEVDASSPIIFDTPSSRAGEPHSNRMGTPLRPRSDIGVSQRIRQINLAVSEQLVCVKSCYRLS